MVRPWLTSDVTDRTFTTREIVRHFDYAHLAPEMTQVAAGCAALVNVMIRELPDGPELSVGLRKLLEARDCFVRAASKE